MWGRIVARLDELTIQRLGFIVAAGLLFATWYQAHLMRQTLHDSQRAFVYVKDTELVGIDPAHPLPPGKTGGITIEFSSTPSMSCRVGRIGVNGSMR
jgi:hypothetical protein